MKEKSYFAPMEGKNNPKTLKAWAFYDWANSAYNLVITTAIFPMFYTAVTTPKGVAENEARIEFFGRSMLSSELYSYVLAASFLLIAISSPILAGIADYTGRKKRFLQIFNYIGAFACAALFFFDVNHIELSMVPVFFASVGFWGSIVFYNSFLPEIATPDLHDKWSARGFSIGYLGSVLLLISLLIGIQAFNMPARWSFPVVGVWWLGFAQYTFAHLPSKTKTLGEKVGNQWNRGIKELQKVWKSVNQMPVIKSYLLSYFVYNTGVQTVMLLAVIFANQEINWAVNPATGEKDTSGLIVSIILIQLIAIVGAYAMAKLSAKIGNFRVIMITLGMWIIGCSYAFIIHEPWEFYVLATWVGFIMGGIQSMSRSTYAKLIPDTKDHASYFSFYDVTEKVGLAIGPFLFGLIAGLTGSMRYSVLMLISLFIIGWIALFVTRRITLKQGNENQLKFLLGKK